MDIKFIVMSAVTQTPIRIFDNEIGAQNWIETLPSGKELDWILPFELDPNIEENINTMWFKEWVYINTVAY